MPTRRRGNAQQLDLAHIVEPLRPFAVEISSLHFDEANVRKHDERNLESIKRSLAEFGQRQPIVVQRDGMIIRAGNGRMMAAQSLGWTHIAAIVVDDAEHAAVAYGIADNRTADLAEWDERALIAALRELESTPYFEATGFMVDEIRELDMALRREAERERERNARGGDQSSDVDANFAVLVTCAGETEQVELLNRFLAEGLECRALNS